MMWMANCDLVRLVHLINGRQDFLLPVLLILSRAHPFNFYIKNNLNHQLSNLLCTNLIDILVETNWITDCSAYFVGKLSLLGYIVHHIMNFVHIPFNKRSIINRLFNSFLFLFK